MGAYRNYIEERTAVARACMRDLGCQPVLFLGSGLASVIPRAHLGQLF